MRIWSGNMAGGFCMKCGFPDCRCEIPKKKKKGGKKK
tara:strand:+ start:148 stop:258 length:111 start_codon:yes stop_codon:yes gene_type:complete